jgi:ribose transport system substrate-binding protein
MTHHRSGKKAGVLLSTFGLAFAVGLAGCATESNSQDNTDAQKTVGLVLFDSTDEFNQSTGKGVTEAADAAGWKVVKIEAAGSVDKVNTAIQNFVSQKVDGIITTVVSSESLASGLAQAKEAGIPVVTQDGGLADGISAAVMVVNEESNSAIIDKVFQDMDGNGKLLAFTYAPGLPCKLRGDTLSATSAKYPDVEVETYELPGTGVPQAGASAAAAWLTKNRDYTGNMAIWGCYDDPAVGAMSSVKQDGRSVRIYGYNGSEGALQGIKDGTFTATLLFDPEMLGEKTFGTLLDVLDDPNAEPHEVGSDYILITSDNAGEYLK